MIRILVLPLPFFLVLSCVSFEFRKVSKTRFGFSAYTADLGQIAHNSPCREMGLSTRIVQTSQMSRYRHQGTIECFDAEELRKRNSKEYRQKELERILTGIKKCLKNGGKASCEVSFKAISSKAHDIPEIAKYEGEVLARICISREAQPDAILCNYWGMWEANRKNFAGAFKAFHASCEVHDGIGCANYSYLIGFQNSKYKKILEKALMLLKKECSAGISLSCGEAENLAKYCDKKLMECKEASLFVNRHRKEIRDKAKQDAAMNRVLSAQARANEIQIERNRLEREQNYIRFLQLRTHQEMNDVQRDQNRILEMKRHTICTKRGYGEKYVHCTSGH